MSLLRYENVENIVDRNERQYGQIFTDEDLNLLDELYLIPSDVRILDSTIPQIHIYSFYGDYIAGNHKATYLKLDKYSKSLLIDVAETFRQANITRGSYKIAINLLKPVWGDPTSHKVFIQEISPDRTEIAFKITPEARATGELNTFINNVNQFESENILNNLVADFGFNRLAKIALVKADPNDPTLFYVKLYKELLEDVVEKDTAWFSFEVIDPYIDSVILTTEVAKGQVNVLRNANYDIDVDQYDSNATILKSWDDLLDSDATTTQRIIDQTISGSDRAHLNIDFTDFNNFVFYSSAEERIKNFYYKLGQIESYNQSIATLTESTASITSYVSSSVQTFTDRIDTIKSNFDSFERWLYYEPTASLFTHDITGSVTPYPKYLSGGNYVVHHTTSSLGLNWYNGLVASASYYDDRNINSLKFTIPEHVLMDVGNENYITFVEMVAQHFDNLWGYVNALTKIHERDEHPQRGASNDLLYYIARSFGWKLQNARGTTNLWKYKTGLNATGSYDSTGSMFSLSHENQTHQLWRRIVNNLPYLLKTKGTSRSVKALMSIYGIPQTLISIKEYGGAFRENDRPQLIEDRYQYALNFDGAQYVQMDRVQQSGISNGVVPDEILFRFNTTYSGSNEMTLFNIESGSFNNTEIRIAHSQFLTGTGSRSGSYSYGKLELLYNDNRTTYSSSTSFLPLFDGDMWTVRLFTDQPITQSTATASLNLEVARADDCTQGTYIKSGSTSLSLTGDFSNFIASSGSHYVRLGGSDTTDGISADGTGSYFSGSMHAYKEYFTNLSKTTFDEHVLNPLAYHTNNPTSSYDYLYRYFPLGVETIRYDHTVSSSISSSHPNQNKTNQTVANFFGFSGGQDDQYRSFSETHYVYTPSIGAENIRNQKIRLEDSKLTRDLNPTARSEKSAYDDAPIDTDRLAIVYSLSDQVNRDIFNQFGFDALDEYIADPEYQFRSEYSELRRFREEYFKKYEQINDINAFIRILSVYDYTFFEQIKQLTPARADLIAGILIEPHILERPKVEIMKRPVVTNPQYEDVIDLIPDDQSGEFPNYEGTASAQMDYEMEYQTYASGTIPEQHEISYLYSYLSGSIPDPVELSGSSYHHQDIIHQKTGICGVVDTVPTRYSGSNSTTQSYVDNVHINTKCKYYKVDFHYSGSGTFESRYLKNWYAAVSRSYGWYYSRSLDETGYQIDECSSRNNSRFRGSKLIGSKINKDSSMTVDGGAVVRVIESNPNNLFIKGDGDDGNLLVE